jgi:hypothetical protein
MGIFLTSSQVKGNFLCDCLRGKIIDETVSQGPTSLRLPRRGEINPESKEIKMRR